MSGTQQKVRIDKWLWATRIYRTRSLAAEACRGGHVRVGGLKVKPSRNASIGDTIVAQTVAVKKTVRVIALLERRVGAKLVEEYLEDLTPPEERVMKRVTVAQSILQRDRGTGRPTKKDRRDIDRLMGEGFY